MRGPKETWLGLRDAEQPSGKVIGQKEKICALRRQNDNDNRTGHAAPILQANAIRYFNTTVPV
jgi:hypothetical protein